MAVIGIDIDGTLAGNGQWADSETIADPDQRLVDFLHGLLIRGHVLCAWSCRADHVVDRWLTRHHLRFLFEYINESPYPTDSAKASFDLLIDDKAFGWTPEAPFDVILARIEEEAAKYEVFDRDIDFSDRNPKVFYQGTGRLYVDKFEGLWQNEWEKRAPTQKVAFLTNCSHAKPYSKSHIHSMIRQELHKADVLSGVDYIHISGAGIVAAAFEMVYPFNAYDGNMAEATDNARAHLRKSVTRRLNVWRDFYSHDYDHIVIYLRSEGNTIRAVREFMEANATDLRIELILATEGDEHTLPYALDNDVDDALIAPANINPLIARLKELLK